jgi:hypothetical protein
MARSQKEAPQNGVSDNGLALASEMAAEAYREAKHALLRKDQLVLYAKHDALTELCHRLRGGRPNPYWARRTLVATAGEETQGS